MQAAGDCERAELNALSVRCQLRDCRINAILNAGYRRS